MPALLHLADAGFFLFHTLLIAFNMFGWIGPALRVWHAISMGLTSFSWFVMGAFYGWGYCLCTDWHFQIRDRLGYADAETSYVQLLARTLLGIRMSRLTADILAGSVFVLILIAMAVVWARQWKKRSASGREKAAGTN